MAVALLAFVLWVSFARGQVDSTSAEAASPVGPLNITELNSPKSDFAPFVMPDGRTIYFASSRDGGFGGEDIYVSRWEGGRWSTPENLGEPVNSRYNEGAMCISPDGRELYLTICGRPDSYGECDIYVCYRRGDGWSEPRNLGKKVNSTWWDGHPSLSPSGDTLFFASDRFGGFGGMDIYFTYKTPDGWSKAKNLGYPINNARDQTSPFLHIDGRTLYFSSAGHGGLGGLDVVMSRLDTSTGKWSDPVNIGPPVNTAGNDYFFSVPGSGEFIYFASDRPGGYGGFDIYSYPLEEWQRPQIIATLVGRVVDAETGAPVYATVEIERLADGKLLQKTNTDSITGQFFVVLRAGETYGISVSAPGYAFASENYEVKVQAGYQELHHTFRLKRIAVGSVVELVNIFFDFGKSDLRAESKPELERVAELMAQYPDMKIEVQGFADSIGSTEFNLWLSRQRAKAVYDWLTSHGVDSSRVTYRGYGEEERGATEEELQKSRRVQFKILELGGKPYAPKKLEGGRGELKIDTTRTQEESLLEDYKKLLANVDLKRLADSLFEVYITSGGEYHFAELQERPAAVKTAVLGYPQRARDAGLEGVVLVKFQIDTLGNVVPKSASVVVAIPPGIFEKAAIEAIYHWKFTPAVLNGRKVSIPWLQPLVFKLGGGRKSR